MMISNFDFPHKKIEESKFILYDYSHSISKKKQIISNPKELSFQKCYLLQKNQFQYFISKINNNSAPNKLKAKTINLGSFNQNQIISTMEEVFTITEFYVVNKEFLDYTDNQKIFYEKQNIYLHKNENKVYLFFPDEPNGQNILEIIELQNIDNNEIKNNENFKNNIIYEQKKKILKKCLLLTAFERDLFKLFEKSIEDEYNDIREYYLININWIMNYKNNYSLLFNNIYQLLNIIKFDIKYLYNYLYYNIDDSFETNEIKNLLNIINNISLEKNLTLEDYFYPIYNKENNFYYPSVFVIVPEKLFDLFYEDIEKKKYNKNDYRVVTLIGEKALFIQDKNNKGIFYNYIINDSKNIQLYNIFQFQDKNLFFKVVNRYIKGKGFTNYLLEKNLNLDLLNQNQFLCEKEKVEYLCIIKEKCPTVYLRMIEIRNEIKLMINLFASYQKFLEQIKNLPDYNNEINNINDILKYNLQTIPIIIISRNDLDLLKEKMFFKELEYFSKITKEYNKIEEFLINKFKSQPIVVKNIISNIKILGDENNLDHILKSDKYIFSFINADLIKLMNQSQENTSLFLKFSNGKFLLFKNKKEYYVFYEKLNRLFKLVVINKTDFKLEEFIGNNKNMIKLLKKNINLEKNQEAQFKSPLKYISEPKNYYLVNKNWMDKFKKLYKYEEIKKYSQYDDDTINKYIKINQGFPDELKVQNNLNPQTSLVPNINILFPSNFYFVEREIFDLILNEINTKFNIFLKVDKYYKISFCDKKLFINDISNNKIFLIYSFNNSNFDLDYIIQLNHGVNLNSFFSSCGYSETLEQYLINNFALNLKEKGEQIMIDLNFNNFGNIWNIKPKLNINMKEVRHCLGLENIGATCYMNATIQSLCNVFSLKKYFLNRKLIYQDTYNKNCQLTLEFYKLINHLWKESYHGKSYYTPRSFKDKISELNPLFQGIAANDSKDLIYFLFEKMHEELNNPDYQNNKALNVINNNELRNFRNNYYSKNSSIFSKTFYFEQESQLRCLNCNFNKLSYTIYNIIIFPLEKVREYMVKKFPHGFMSVKLEDCFENYQEEEILCGTNQIYCNQCGQMANASSSNKIFTLPEVMTIILNRGKGIEFDVNFEYPLKLNVDRFVLDKQCTNNNYELICVLSHIGPSGMAGHFISFCKSPIDDRWYIYNDAQVKECYDPRYPNDDMIEGLPYVLFYQRCNSNRKNQENDFNINSFNKMDKYDFNNENHMAYSNKMTLYFRYNDKELYLDTEKEKRFYDLINELHRKYELPKNISLYLETNNNLIPLEYNKKIEDYPSIKNKTSIICIGN